MYKTKLCGSPVITPMYTETAVCCGETKSSVLL